MTLHLLKLCVGAQSIEDMRLWIATRKEEAEARGLIFRHHHTTRMMPKRQQELLAGGSLYWIIKGHIVVRQTLVFIENILDEDGKTGCQLGLDEPLIAVEPQKHRPFQGWRYLEGKDAPPDLGASTTYLEKELASLGLL